MADNDRTAYCGRCGNTLSSDDRFCGNCEPPSRNLRPEAEQVIPREEAAENGARSTTSRDFVPARPRRRVLLLAGEIVGAGLLDEDADAHTLLDVEDVLVLAAVWRRLLLLGVAVQVEEVDVGKALHQTAAHSTKDGIVEVTMVGDKGEDTAPGSVYTPLPKSDEFHVVGSLLSRDEQVKRMSFSDGVKQRSQLRWRGHLRPRPPKAPEHYPRVQPPSHPSQGQRPRRRSVFLFFLFGILFFSPPAASTTGWVCGAGSRTDRRIEPRNPPENPEPVGRADVCSFRYTSTATEAQPAIFNKLPTRDNSTLQSTAICDGCVGVGMPDSQRRDEPKQYCPNCRSQVRSGNAFCVACGTRLDGGDAEQQSGANAAPRSGTAVRGSGGPLLWGNARLAMFGAGALLLLFIAYLLLSYSAFLGGLVIGAVVLAVLVSRRIRGVQTDFERRLFEVAGQSRQSARETYEEVNTRYRRWSQEQAAERERSQLLRKFEGERNKRRGEFERYRSFFERAHGGAQTSLDWWQAYDGGSSNENSSVSALLRSTRDRAKAGLEKLRSSEGQFSDMLGSDRFGEADQLLDDLRKGQEDFEGEESVFPPLVAVHDRVKRLDGWDNYKAELERFVKYLEDLLDSPAVRTAPANRVRYPDPGRARPSDLGETSIPDPYSQGSTRGKLCHSCGVQNVPQATFCRDCGASLQPASTRTAPANTGAITVGYVVAFLPLLLLPLVFTPAGVGLGIFNVIQGQAGHGVAQIAIACFTGVLGTIIGGAGLGI